MKSIFLLKAIIKMLPGIQYIRNFNKNNGGETLSAKYCYSVWLRHLVLAYESGITTIPKRIAELGPGDSLGVGIAALISGAEEYFAFDIVRYQPAEVNLKIFEELVLLFKNRTPIPGNEEFPTLKPALSSYAFPSNIFGEKYLQEILREDRLADIRRSIDALNGKQNSPRQNMITYTVPWNDSSLITYNYLDMIISQAVIQHVENVEEVFEITSKWLKPNGLMSYRIDLSSVGSSGDPQGHWSYSDFEWKLMRGKSTFLLNRAPYSTYMELFKRNNLKVIFEIKNYRENPIDTGKLSKRFKLLSLEDRSITGLFVQALKQ